MKEIIYEFYSMGDGKCRACQCSVNWGQLPEHDESIEHIDKVKELFELKLKYAIMREEHSIHQVDEYKKIIANMVKNQNLNTEGWGDCPAQFY